MLDTDQLPDTISRESYEREKGKVAALESQLSQATRALTDYQRRDEAFRFYLGSVGDDAVRAKATAAASMADLVTPHLAEVEKDKVAEFLATDRFKPILESMSAQAPPANGAEPPAPDGTPPLEGAPPATEPLGGFNSPSPGGTTGTQSLDTKTRVKVGSPEYQAAIASNNLDQIEKWDKEGLLERPARPW